MLKRDLPNDYCQRYLSQVSKQQFYSQIQSSPAAQKVYLNKNQLAILQNQSNKTTRIIQATGAASLLAFMLFNKIPVLGNIQNKLVKIVARFGLFLGPTYAVAMMQVDKIQQIKALVFDQQIGKYKDFMKCGDFTRLNPEILLVEQ